VRKTCTVALRPSITETKQRLGDAGCLGAALDRSTSARQLASGDTWFLQNSIWRRDDLNSRRRPRINQCIAVGATTPQIACGIKNSRIFSGVIPGYCAGLKF